ncbi:U2 small nuclear ribonucleoprotein A' [Neolecta irregularis DAH-3]|uniref:U2 small nuclear ribonucleoprotein A' n=1 Tax=Neolecta irregularis (strain DAH-3) TaxID=1198029 RepID=A0A1U7LS87_NEOID|nr:U2 small nuclear ribonucleoprotein A' [Neolecta irregularis DAH-3]|eukprot:OLL25381.1 U2 small nuclear ribonucleoprotein A' [Neolecta irregularis DAH-3]
MKLTPELLAEAPSYINPIKERELFLRGHKLPTIENLGVSRDTNDSIDFTDNDIRYLGNFPKFLRLKTLLLSRNRITTIDATLAKSVPNLSCVILTSNSIGELADLDILGELPRLEVLAVMDNPVAQKEYYREWLIWRCHHVRYLDFVKVKDSERKRAKALFEGKSGELTDLGAMIKGLKTRTFEVGGTENGEKSAGPMRLTEAEQRQIEEAIKNAKSLNEVARLEGMLREGRIPQDKDVQMAG